jgi:hypothetical protein
MLKFIKRNSLILGLIACILGFITGLVCLITIDVTHWEQTFITIIISNSIVLGIFLLGRLQEKRKQIKGK